MAQLRGMLSETPNIVFGTNAVKAREVLNVLLRRCVECPEGRPSCPSCAADETCSLTQQSCNQCATTTCVKLNQFAGQVSEAKPATPVGPIVGGVIGGVVIILVGIFCYWYFRRSRKRKDTWDPPEKRDQTTLTRSSTRPHSIASTVQTRASNVIQIAYIPGVTGRSPPLSPTAPPMPTTAGSSIQGGTPQPDTHFFMADDLRNSTWSENTVDPRISLAPSLARASSATTVYYESAVVPPIPAQHAFRAQANMVSVKQGGSVSPSPSSASTANRTKTPTQGQGGPKPVTINNSSIVARNVTARPIELKKTGSGSRTRPADIITRANSQKSAVSTATVKAEPIFEEKEVVMTPVTDIVDSPTSPVPALRTKPSQMSLGNNSVSGISSISAVTASEGALGRQGGTPRPDSGGLTAMIEDAIKNASADTRRSPRPANQRMDSGPFSDVHELPITP